MRPVFCEETAFNVTGGDSHVRALSFLDAHTLESQKLFPIILYQAVQIEATNLKG